MSTAITTSASSTGQKEIASLTKYYEHDGMLRAYANRAMFLAVLFAVIAIGSLGCAIYLRLQPPTIIRIDKNGEANVVGARTELDSDSKLAAILSAQAATTDPAANSVAPTDLEARAVLRRFLQH